MLHVEDMIIEVRDVSFQMIGQINMNDLVKFKSTKTFNNTGAWEMWLPAEAYLADVLTKPGHGILVTGPDNRVYTSGPMVSFELDQTEDDPTGTYHIIGADDNVRLADALALPQPSNPDPTTQTEDNDIRTGVGETIMRGYVSDNIGPTAPAENKIPNLQLQPDLGRGATAIGNARFDVLGALLAGIGTTAGLGFDLVQSGNTLQFMIYEPYDQSSLVRMDFENQTLAESKYGLAAPTITEEYVAGQGQGADRKILSVTTDAAQAAATLWGRKIRVFRDGRDTNDDTELIQRGTDDVTAGGDTQFTLSATPSDIQTMEYGTDWYLGDIVAVVVGDQETKAVVMQSILTITTDGVDVGAVVGSLVGFDWESKLIDTVKSHAARIDFMERNFEQGPASPTRAGNVMLATPAATIAGTDSTSAVTPAGVAAAVGAYGDALVPSGTVVMTAVSAAPSGWLICDGSSKLRTDYPDLFSAIGTTYGSADSTHFTLPNLKGRVPVGIDSGQTEFNTRGKTGGEKTHVLTDAEMPSHTHSGSTNSTGDHTHDMSFGDLVGSNPTGTGYTFLTSGTTDRTKTTTSDGAHSHSVTIGSAGSDAAHNNLQPYIALNFIIKT